jgi:hypothetical protein
MNEKGKKKVVRSFDELSELLQDVVKEKSNEQGKN